MPIIRGSDNTVRLRGPTNKATGSALDNTNASATATFNLYNERSETRIFPAETRFREDVASGTTFTIPHTVPQWLEPLDSVFIVGDDNEQRARTVLSVTPGTDEDTPGTNFDTVVLTQLLGGPVSKGGKITLRRKVSSGLYLPIYPQNVPFRDEENVEVQLNDLTVKAAVLSAVYSATRSTEDGFVAKSQDEYPVILINAALGVNADAERRVRSLLTAVPISMTEYPAGGAGTPPVDATWKTSGGFSGTIPDTQLDLEIGDQVRVEVLFNGGAGLFLIASTIEPVIGHGG